MGNCLCNSDQSFVPLHSQNTENNNAQPIPSFMSESTSSDSRREINLTKKEAILSPVHGQVELIEDKNISIYIAQTDNHDILAPVSGIIEITNVELGKLFLKDNKAVIFEEEKIFQIPGHNARITFKINGISFYVEVGKPDYITDKVRLYFHNKDFVRQGAKIGEILIGSRAKVMLNDTDYKVIVNLRDKLVAGHTILAI